MHVHSHTLYSQMSGDQVKKEPNVKYIRLEYNHMSVLPNETNSSKTHTPQPV